VPSITDIREYKKTGICPCCGYKSNFFNIDIPSQSFLKELIDESKRVGKVVWTCDSGTHHYLNDIMNKLGIKERETMEETIARRKEERK